MHCNFLLKINNFLLKIRLKKNNSRKIEKNIVLLTNIKSKNLIIYYINVNYKLNLIKFIILILTTKSNIFLHILDSLGTQILFYSIGLIKLKKNYNQKTAEVLQIYFKKILTNLTFIKNKPIIFHLLLNINYTFKLFLYKLIKKIRLIYIKIIDNISFNGCRKKKI